MTVVERDMWVDVCRLEQLTPERGVAALVEGEQVALFHLRGGEVLAVGNHDPFSGANVMSRGLVGSVGSRVVIASPVYKHRFDLRTGLSLDDPDVVLRTFTTRVADGVVQVLAT
jgi:nitrite reductase (NADH) small subunit